MARIYPTPSSHEALLQAAEGTAAAAHGDAAGAMGSTAPYFETRGAVQIGPYSGRLRYLTPPLAKRPTRAIAELDEAVQKQRSLCRKLFDKVFRGIGLDGQVLLTETQFHTFRYVDSLYGLAVDSIGQGKRTEASENIACMAASMEVIRDASAALARIRTAGRKGDRSALERIAVSISVPIVAEAAWRDAVNIRRLVALCSTSRHILSLAETGDPMHQGSAVAGLCRMLDDDATIQRIADTLANEIRGMSFSDARRRVLPFLIQGAHSSFAIDRAGQDRVPRLWIALRDTVATSEDAAILANDHVACGLGAYHRAMNFVLSDKPTSDRIRLSLLDLLHMDPLGNGWRISPENGRKVTAFLTGTAVEKQAQPGTALSRSALQLVWGHSVIATAIDKSARDAIAADGDTKPLQPLLRTHPNKNYVAQYCRISPVIDTWSRVCTSRYGAREEIHAGASNKPRRDAAAVTSFAVA
ncbi:hypothetical protein NDR89_10925 [Cupriavidus gilardii]|uniref:Uncharacterized protein n=1 Tax=Cupriavidus gilardii TaxID=82541 RepID=A0ABY4VY29_9BURK|nr:hypothetical protein [Cupriavidus gilardii]USE80303.1 hypothetical protein NDR89_10925 [Cupriavidus gilardii]